MYTSMYITQGIKHDTKKKIKSTKLLIFQKQNVQTMYMGAKKIITRK